MRTSDLACTVKSDDKGRRSPSKKHQDLSFAPDIWISGKKPQAVSYSEDSSEKSWVPFERSLPGSGITFSASLLKLKYI